MTLTTRVGLAPHTTIGFGGVGAAGRPRTILRFDYVTQGSLRRVDFVASPVEDWMGLIKQWAFQTHVNASLTIRTERTVLLSLDRVFPLHFAVQGFDAGAGVQPLALLSFGAEQVLHAGVRPVVVSSLARYLPPSVLQRWARVP